LSFCACLSKISSLKVTTLIVELKPLLSITLLLSYIVLYNTLTKTTINYMRLSFLLFLLLLLLPWLVSATSASAHFERLSVTEGKVWIATAHAGVNKENNNGFDTLINNPSDPSSLSNDIVNTLSQGSNGTLWVGTVNGLNHYNPINGRFTRYNYNKTRSQSLSHHLLIHLLYDRKGYLWAATRIGLNRFIPQSRAFETLLHDPSSPNRLSNDSIMRVFEDHKGFIWIATIKRLANLGDKNLELVNAVPTTLPAVEADENRLLQIMHNLVGNAINLLTAVRSGSMLL
jgi:ligand-binding sensor domain-containing protein